MFNLNIELIYLVYDRLLYNTMLWMAAVIGGKIVLTESQRNYSQLYKMDLNGISMVIQALHQKYDFCI